MSLMMVSNASPLAAHDFAVLPLLRSKFRVQKQSRHADDAIHGGADFVTHIGQELALGPAGSFGSFPGVAHLLLDLLALSNVLSDACHPDQFAGLAADGEAAVANPLFRSLRSVNSILRVN